MIEVERIKFMLDDQVIETRALGTTASRAWRALIKTQAGTLADVLTGNNDALDALELGDLRDITNTDINQLVPLLQRAFEQVNDAYDVAPEIVQHYAPGLVTADLLNRATTAQIIGAMVEMVRVEFASPFQTILSPATGPAAESTSSSSAAPNGVSASAPSTASTPTS